MEDIKVNRKNRREANIKSNIIRILKNIGNAITVVVCGILVLIIITSCINMFQIATHPGKIPSIFGYKVMTVLTGSMGPKIKPGDLAIASNIKDLDSIKVGTIVSYMNKENVLITHRVEEINNKAGAITYITKGDANPVADVEPVTQNQLEGTYVTKIPYIGYVSMFVKTGAGMISLIVIPLVLMMGIEIINYFKKLRTKKIKSIQGNTL
ncbi:MAG TPA: signal peptidase I [Clostridiaceae bacterium]